MEVKTLAFILEGFHNDMAQTVEEILKKDSLKRISQLEKEKGELLDKTRELEETLKKERSKKQSIARSMISPEITNSTPMENGANVTIRVFDSDQLFALWHMVGIVPINNLFIKGWGDGRIEKKEMEKLKQLSVNHVHLEGVNTNVQLSLSHFQATRAVCVTDTAIVGSVKYVSARLSRATKNFLGFFDTERSVYVILRITNTKILTSIMEYITKKKILSKWRRKMNIKLIIESDALFDAGVLTTLNFLFGNNIVTREFSLSF